MAGKLLIPSLADHQGGSGRGMSYWLSFLNCALRGHLDRLGVVIASPEGEEDGKPKDSDVGVLFHQLLEHYHGGTLDTCALEYADGPGHPAWVEALRLFAEYRKRHTPEEFGKVISCEEHFELGSEEDDGDHSYIQWQSLENFGVPRFSGRKDMVIRAPDQEGCDRILAKHGIMLEPGGLYYFDTKTKKARMSSLSVEMNESLQFHSYMMYGKLVGENVLGTIANVVVRHKGLVDNSFVKILVPFPSVGQQEMVKETLALSYRRREEDGEMQVNPSRCFDYFKVCPYLGGHCSRKKPLALSL